MIVSRSIVIPAKDSHQSDTLMGPKAGIHILGRTWLNRSAARLDSRLRGNDGKLS